MPSSTTHLPNEDVIRRKIPQTGESIAAAPPPREPLLQAGRCATRGPRPGAQGMPLPDARGDEADPPEPVVHADATGQARAGGEVGDLERVAASAEKRGRASGNQRALRVGNSNAGAVPRGIADTRH